MPCIDSLYCDDKDKWNHTTLNDVKGFGASELGVPGCKQYQEEYLPIVYAVRFGAGEDIVAYMQDSYHQGIVWQSAKDGSTLLHHACYDNMFHLVPYLLVMYPDALHKQKLNGKTPLQIAKSYQRKKCVDFLENPYDTIIDYFRQNNEHKRPTANSAFPNGTSLLHYAIVFDKLEEITELIDSNPQSCATKRDFDDKYAAHLLAELKHTTDQPWFYIYSSIIDIAPETLGMLDNSQQTPLHYITRQHLCASVVEYIKVAVDANPAAFEVLNGNGWTPLHIIVQKQFDKKCPPPEDVQVLHFQLTKLIHSAMNPEFKDEEGREPTEVAKYNCTWPKVVKWSKCLGTKYGRYKLQNENKPIYRSKTCEVYVARDVEEKDERVCLKIIRDEEHFLTEKNARDRASFSDDFVVKSRAFIHYRDILALNEHHQLEEGEDSVPSWIASDYKEEYCIVMELGSSNLQRAISDERFAGYNSLAVRMIGEFVAKSLLHMHINNVIHGDLKPRNIVSVGMAWKLIDLDSSSFVNEPIGKKYSSAYSPPELARLLFTKSGESIDYLLQKQDKTTSSSSAISGHSFNCGERKLLDSASPSFDVWGFGCVFYQLCSGRPLFTQVDSSDDNIFDEKAAICLRNWHEIDNRRLSFVFQEKDDDDPEKSLAKDLLRKCLKGDQTLRISSMEEVLAHKFFSVRAKRGTEFLSCPDETAYSGTRGGGKKILSLDLGSQWSADEMYPDGSFAAIVGIDDYDNDGVPVDLGGMRSLHCAVSDANLMKETLVEKGFVIVSELLNSQATAQNVKEMIDTVKEMLKGKKRARFVLFLASHGYFDEENEETWMMCYGGNTNKLASTCVDLNEIKKMSKRLDTTHQLYVLDCCHAGGLFAGTRGAPTKYETQLMKSPAVYGMTAVTEDQEAMEAHGHGLFTRAIVDGLKGNAPEFQRGEDHLTAGQLFEYASRSVFQAAQERSHVQTPKFEPLQQMHKKKSCDGQFLFFVDASHAAQSKYVVPFSP